MTIVEIVQVKGAQGTSALRKILEGIKKSSLEEKGLKILLGISQKDIIQAEREIEHLSNLYGE